MNPFLITNNCCCAQECSSFWTITDQTQIQNIKNDPDYRYRMSIPCSSLTQKTINQKFVVEGNIQGVVTENASTGPGQYQNNKGRGGGQTMTQTGGFYAECGCVIPGGQFSTLSVEGPFVGKYTYSSLPDQPYSVAITATVPGIVFLCGGNYVDVYSEWIAATNLQENPSGAVNPPGLNSTGTVTLNLFGHSATITLLNNWTPDWSGDEGFQGNWRLDASFTVNLADCYE